METPAMKFPTLQEVQSGTLQQVEEWWNFLPMPQNDAQREILHQVVERMLDLSEAIDKQSVMG